MEQLLPGLRRLMVLEYMVHCYHHFKTDHSSNEHNITGTAGASTIATDNGTLQLSAAVSPSNATNKTVTWSIANGTGQASISSSGLVTAIVNGTVTARATSK